MLAFYYVGVGANNLQIFLIPGEHIKFSLKGPKEFNIISADYS